MSAPVVVVGDLKKSCGDCTACCSGALSGEAHGHHFYKGRPCFFITKKGCSIYENRPENPCVSFKCGFLSEPFFPEWMRPDLCGILATMRVMKTKVTVTKDGAETEEEKFIPYMQLLEYGQPMTAKALWWFIQKHLTGEIPNLLIDIEGGQHRMGSLDFLKA
jgi:hypothetical protein